MIFKETQLSKVDSFTAVTCTVTLTNACAPKPKFQLRPWSLPKPALPDQVEEFAFHFISLGVGGVLAYALEYVPSHVQTVAAVPQRTTLPCPLLPRKPTVSSSVPRDASNPCVLFPP